MSQRRRTKTKTSGGSRGADGAGVLMRLRRGGSRRTRACERGRRRPTARSASARGRHHGGQARTVCALGGARRGRRCVWAGRRPERARVTRTRGAALAVVEVGLPRPRSPSVRAWSKRSDGRHRVHYGARQSLIAGAAQAPQRPSTSSAAAATAAYRRRSASRPARAPCASAAARA